VSERESVDASQGPQPFTGTGVEIAGYFAPEEVGVHGAAEGYAWVFDGEVVKASQTHKRV